MSHFTECLLEWMRFTFYKVAREKQKHCVYFVCIIIYQILSISGFSVEKVSYLHASHLCLLTDLLVDLLQLNL